MHELRPVCRALFAIALLSILSLRFEPLTAHHGWAGYLDAEFELTGTRASAGVTTTRARKCNMSVRTAPRVPAEASAREYRCEGRRQSR
jgi:hypothetical protein